MVFGGVVEWTTARISQRCGCSYSCRGALACKAHTGYLDEQVKVLERQEGTVTLKVSEVCLVGSGGFAGIIQGGPSVCIESPERVFSSQSPVNLNHSGPPKWQMAPWPPSR